MIVIDPRFTRTAAHATEYVRLRSGTDIPVIWGMLWHIFQNGWEDKEFIRQRVYGMDDVRKEVAKWTPDEVERVTGVPGEQLKRVAELFADREARDADLVHGRDPAHGRHGQRPRLLHPVPRDRQRRQAGHGRQHLPRPHQRAGRDRSRPRYHDAAALLRPRRGRLEALGARLGGRVRLAARPVRRGAGQGRAARPRTRKENMETPGITSTRWFDAREPARGSDRPAHRASRR